MLEPQTGVPGRFHLFKVVQGISNPLKDHWYPQVYDGAQRGKLWLLIPRNLKNDDYKTVSGELIGKMFMV